MNNNPTLREAAQAFEDWLSSQSHTVRGWLRSVGDIHVGTVFAVVMIGLSVIFAVALLVWLVQFSKLTVKYRALGYTWLRALRLGQADIEDERIGQQRKTNPYFEGQRSRLAATPTEREAWAHDLEQERHSP
jgi:hypothetical protein